MTDSVHKKVILQSIRIVEYNLSQPIPEKSRPYWLEKLQIYKDQLANFKEIDTMLESYPEDTAKFTWGTWLACRL
jgi:hypothetical protein